MKSEQSDNNQTSNDLADLLRIGRFSAWFVFGLSIITIGIYPIYWMYTRAKIINSLHENKISSTLLTSLIIVTVLSYGLDFFGSDNDLESEISIDIVGLFIGLVYLILYLVVLFKIRNRLQIIINRTSNQSYELGSVFTFFFFVIYLQYKINQSIDELHENT